MNTHFAPTARSSPEEIAHSHRTLADDGVLTQTLDAFPELVLVLNQNREVVLANEVACRALGRTVPEMLGKRPGELVECEQVRKAPCGCGTSEACRTCGAVFAILESQQGRPSIRECRVSRRTAKGFESLDLRVACRALTAQAESFTVFVATDISAEKRRDVLERIFFHDILNLAGVVQGFVSLLVDNLLTIEEVKDDLHSSTSSLVCEIHSQQALLEAEKGLLELEMCRLNSHDLLRDIRQAYARHPAATNRDLIVAGDAETFTLLTDRTILSRVLGNLAKNALEASPAGGRVTLNCHRSTSGGVFTCHNSGCMRAEVQLQMFQRSFSTKGRGRGVGTYSVKLLTEKYLQGRVGFSSTAQSGTTFEVALPDCPRFTPATMTPGNAAN